MGKWSDISSIRILAVSIFQRIICEDVIFGGGRGKAFSCGFYLSKQ